MKQELKPGVRLLGMVPQLPLAMNIVKEVYFEYGYDHVITSIVEGVHSRASIHYNGGAFDNRTRHTSEGDRPKIRDECARRLGDDFDVVLVEGDKPHLHVEYQPKKPY